MQKFGQGDGKNFILTERCENFMLHSQHAFPHPPSLHPDRRLTREESGQLAAYPFLAEWVI